MLHNATITHSDAAQTIADPNCGEDTGRPRRDIDVHVQVELAYIERANQRFVEARRIQFELSLLRHQGITLEEYLQRIDEEERLIAIGLNRDLMAETQRRRPNRKRMTRLTTGRYVPIKDSGTTARKRQIAAANARRDSRMPHSVRAKRRQAKSTRYAK